jgi:hypothetical protein
MGLEGDPVWNISSFGRITANELMWVALSDSSGSFLPAVMLGVDRVLQTCSERCKNLAFVKLASFLPSLFQRRKGRRVLV